MTEEIKAERGIEVAQDRLLSQRRYRKILVIAVLSVSVVAIVPLLIMTAIYQHQYQEVLHAEMTRPMVRLVANGKQSIESFLSERLSALNMVVRVRTFEEIKQSAELDRLLSILKHAFGGFVDLGVIDEEGIQVAYAGPYSLEGKSYRDHDWFHEVRHRGVHVSDVFLGYRKMPHFVIAIQHDDGLGHSFVLRATLDTEVIDRLLRSLLVGASSDAFLVNSNGILQTPSRVYGRPLERSLLPSLPRTTQVELAEVHDERGQPLVVSYADIKGSPFTLVLLNPQRVVHAGWLSLRRDLLVFLAISIVLILIVVISGSTYMINRVRESDMKRAALYHKMEYTNKMAAIGRLGAGVAHEINNPLSIIMEKAGLLKDLLTVSDELPPREKLIGLVDSVIRSAERCGGITHRLLGFAKHMDVQREVINLDLLLREVLSFLEKEASYRGIQVVFDYPDPPPTIVSDRGQLQQVFLNIINNAFAAVEDGGRIEIGIKRAGKDAVAVSIADNGVGVPEEYLPHIFDPFFTTKKGAGTGLGLSITYGIVQKLGGQISVKSKVGEGTCFTVTLPIGDTVA